MTCMNQDTNGPLHTAFYIVKNQEIIEFLHTTCTLTQDRFLLIFDLKAQCSPFSDLARDFSKLFFFNIQSSWTAGPLSIKTLHL